jgi:4'-phosphopantetheinyl transferase EntD
MIEELLPAASAAVEAFDDPADSALFEVERSAVKNAVMKRSREFAVGRSCARRALGRIGRPPVAIPVGERGAPRWPEGVVGSITHCAGYCASAVAEGAELAAIGIDAEPHDALPDGLLDAVALPTEVSHLRELARVAGDIHWDRLLFSAKESVYKAWFPLTRRWLDFSDAVVSINPATQTFGARILVPRPVVAERKLDYFSGRWLVRNGLVLTATTVPASGATHDTEGR